MKFVLIRLHDNCHTEGDIYGAGDPSILTTILMLMTMALPTFCHF